MRPRMCAPYRRAQRRPGPGSRVCRGHLRVASTENGPVRPASAGSASAESGARDECHRATSGGRPVRRAVERGGRAEATGSHPNWLVGPRSSRAGSVPSDLSGAAGLHRDGNGPGNRRPGRQRGIARRAFGHDGRCEVEREANASRSTIGGWFVPLSCPGQRSGSGRSAPGAVRFSAFATFWPDRDEHAGRTAIGFPLPELTTPGRSRRFR